MTLATALCLAFVVAGADAPTSFVGAQGFGASSLGGRGGDVYHVTNLNNSGAGSLRYGIDNAPSGGRTIVFDVGGWIDIDSKLGITKNRVTIAGQTAPGGIGVRGNQFSIGGDDIVIRHMRFRPGKGAGRVDAAGANIDAERIIYDHVSVGFSYDESFSTRANNLTLQYSSVSFGMEDHSAGSLIENGAGNLSFHHNVYAQNDTRNPKARANLIDWRDNVVYNYHNGFIAGDSLTTDFYWRANLDGNTYISETGGRPMVTGGRDWNYGLYFGENAIDLDGDGTADAATVDRAQAMASQGIVSSSYTWETAPFAAPEVWQNEDAAAAYEWTLDHFGATPWARDAVDALTASQVRNRTGSRVSHENQLGIANNGYPTLGGVAAPTDTDRDGMADDWELAHGLNPAAANHNADFDNDGFTDLEEYLMDLAPFPAPGVIAYVGGSHRYAEAQSWGAYWQPSGLDTAHIGAGTVIVDSVGQHAGTLVVAPDAGDTALLAITNGWLRVEDQLTIGGAEDASGSLSLLGGALYTPRLAKSQASTFTFLGGELHADFITFGFTNNGGVLAPGQGVGSTLVLGDVTLAGGSLQIELASDSSFDKLQATGTLALGGLLELERIDGYAPLPYEQFVIAAGTTLGGSRFDMISGMAYAPGMGFAVTYTQTGVVVTAAHLGDADLDGDVDDFDLLAAIAGHNGSQSPGVGGRAWADGDTDGDGDTDDFDLLAMISGHTGSLANTQIPEPGSIVLLGLGGLALIRRHRGVQT